MSPPLRVALPGAIKETCRLCELKLLVENPRRICAHCGEINPPAEHASAPEVPRPVQVQAPPIRAFAAPARTGPVAMNFRQAAAVFMAWLVAGSRWAGNRPAAVATWVSGWASTAALLLVVGFWLMIKSYGR